ncbi:MAG: glycosyltransferase [Sterolibacteriaceae bacterium]|uniref:Glycosyltransferase n=1 Tax=Candidatus Methylophosphatis roskildensis TaxID=2899263 RepID=A0A9D7E5I7_9PROT|nr:glycosyltransferase [Candidatus Methylophosphatis roskildensis]MBK7234763.1 glycosyltransferase [Sterolibacteriaceae bacterium]
MKQARVAVITRTRDRPLLLERALDSVLGQGFTDWTHVVVNDGGDPQFVRSALAPRRDRYQERLALIDNPRSIGMEAASNIGVHASSSEFVVIHDDDDSWHPDFLARCVAFMDSDAKPTLGCDYGGVITHSVRIDEEMLEDGVRIVSSEPFNTWMSAVSLSRLAAGNTFPPISFLFRRDVFDKVGCFREDLPVLGDWDFHLRVCAQYEIGLIPEMLANYHHRASMQSGEYGNTVIANESKHHTYDALYRNDLLRRDLREGKAGLGHLVNTARSFDRLQAQIYPLERLLASLSKIPLFRWFARPLYRGGRSRE